MSDYNSLIVSVIDILPPQLNIDFLISLIPSVHFLNSAQNTQPQ